MIELDFFYFCLVQLSTLAAQDHFGKILEVDLCLVAMISAFLVSEEVVMVVVVDMPDVGDREQVEQ